MRTLLWIGIFTGIMSLQNFAASNRSQIDIPRIAQMPNLPEPYLMRNWKQVAHDFDQLAFNFEEQGEHLPIISWDKGPGLNSPRVFAIPTFIGWNEHRYETITCLGAINAATVAGIDKSKQNGYNWVALCANYFNDRPGINLFLNSPSDNTGSSFWYEIFPNILFYRIYSAYPDTPKMTHQFTAVADQWYRASLAMGGSSDPWILPNYNYTAYNFPKEKPVRNGLWTEGGSAAGIAWLQYMAYTQTKKEKYLDAAKWGMEYLHQTTENPYYEILLPHSTYLAARMNAEIGTHYDVTKLINWSLDGNNIRKWGDSLGKWGQLDFSAVTTSLFGNSNGSYAFAMNTMNKANSFIPMVRYDERYARAIGKWILNAANSLRYFFANGLPQDQQSDYPWAARHDPNFTLAYEGMRPVQSHIGRISADYQTIHGAVTQGSYESTIFTDKNHQTFQSTLTKGNQRLEHIWKIMLKPAITHELNMMAHINQGSQISLSWATQPEGPYQPLFQYLETNPVSKYAKLNTQATTLYLKLENTTPDPQHPATFAIDDLWILSTSDKRPYATGDAKSSGWAKTNFGLYSSAFSGLLGGIIETTNVEKILRLDCLATDYFGPSAYPTYLYFNPYNETKTIELKLGPKRVDLYDACTDAYLKRGASGSVQLELPADDARLLVLVPSDGHETQNEQGHRLVNGIVIDYN